MFSRIMLASAFVSLFTLAPAYAEETKPDDTVSYDLSAEDWVSTKTAHVVLDVEAAVTGSNEGALRTDMIKSVNDVAKADWRLTGFTRIPDQTGMERWSVDFDARLPESDLNGLADAVKKASKPGMQITLANVDFDPTVDELEATRDALRTHIYKEAGEQLVALNAALPGRAYRIAQITFDTMGPMPHPIRKNLMVAMAAAPSVNSDSTPEHAQKIVITAHVTFAALPTVGAH